VKRRPSIAFVALVTVLGVAILAALAWSPAVIQPEPPVGRSRPTPAGGLPSGPETPVSGRLRDVFAYADAEPSAVVAPRPAVSAISVPPPLAPAPPSPVALVGFVRKAGELRVALSIRGEVNVLAEGGSAGGYAVVTIDEDRGVTLRDPEGASIALAPPR
jgi:hypothetical protein